MVDRSYLPYRSAREYQDRKMAKWMGFFLSEHRTALGHEDESLADEDGQRLSEKLLRLQQLYTQNLVGNFTLKGKSGPRQFTGRVISLSQDGQIGLQGEASYEAFTIDDIYSITLEEVIDDEC